MEMYEVGGCVRDSLMGVESKDVDFVVIAPSFESMREELIRRGFRIHVEKPEFATIRAGVPEGDPLRQRTKDADFVLARKDGPSSDGRRPDFTEPGTLHDDLARRDFTVNAMARSVDGTIIDPFGGMQDLRARKLKFVGVPEERIAEDGLRVMRAFRFWVTKGLYPTASTLYALKRPLAADMLSRVSIERIEGELQRMLTFDTRTTLSILGEYPEILDVIFSGRLRLRATLAE